MGTAIDRSSLVGLKMFLECPLNDKQQVLNMGVETGEGPGDPAVPLIKLREGHSPPNTDTLGHKKKQKMVRSNFTRGECHSRTSEHSYKGTKPLKC